MIGRIITIGLAPAWDITCRGRDLDWGRHAEIDGQAIRPAGKALNVSYALAWMGVGSVAAGLWGQDDHDALHRALDRPGSLIDLHMTCAEGRTRQNITVVDTLCRREMHLRQQSALASEHSLGQLDADLGRLVGQGDLCVFAGAMPAGPLLDQTLGLVQTCHQQGARIAVDSHGPCLRRVVDAGLAWLISPNVEELCELLGHPIADTAEALAAAGRGLLDRVDVVLISRGEQGALVVSRDSAWMGRCRTQGKVLSTVGCGDYLLAGFLAGLCERDDPRSSLAKGLKAGTARAWGWAENGPWAQADRDVAVAIERI
jgi:1-phosphofructokinase family hexose kinase